MIEEEIIQRFTGEKVNSYIYGKGHINSISFKNEKCYVSVLFGEGNKQILKEFIADIAFSKRMLSFEDDSKNNAIKLMLKQAELLAGVTAPNNNSKKFLEISPNDVTNILVQKVISDKTIAVDLISLFDDGSYEKELYSEAFFHLERIILGAELEDA